MEQAIDAGMVYGEVAWQIYARMDKKIAAIKAFRHLTGEGLKESKDHVEKWITNGYSYFAKEDEPVEGKTLGELLGK
jgi:ribosomal protein L7/L12